jgi:predicted metal-binding membrane protein
MAIMFPLGMMNVAALGAVTVLVVAERVLPRGRIPQHAAGVALLVLGVAALLRPDLLPGAAAPMGTTMPMG